jgi:selenocysteine-specific translation elongation factor
MPGVGMAVPKSNNQEENNFGFMHNVRSYLVQQKLIKSDEPQIVSAAVKNKKSPNKNVNSETKRPKKEKPVISLQEQRIIDMNNRFKKILNYLKNTKEDVRVLIF